MSTRSRSDELAALTSIAAQVNCTQDLDEILAQALQTTLDVIGERSGEIYLLDEEKGTLVLHSHQGVSETFLAHESQIGADECLCGQAVQAGRLMASADLAADQARTRQTCLREGFGSCVRLPLLAHGEVLGLLTIQSHDHRHFDDADREVLTAIGNQIGIAIANAQLIDSAERREATLHSVMNSLVDGLIMADSHNRVTYMNPCAEVILDLPAFALLGHSLEAMHREIATRVAQPEQTIEALQNAVAAAADAPTVEISLDRPKARTLQVRYFSIHDVEGGYLGMGLLLHDVTRERELDEMKSQLLSTVSHELRTPLASIKGFATTLLRRDVEWEEDSRREFLSIIDEESDRLSELIGNLLDMSRIEAGELPVEPEAIDLASIVQETAVEFQIMTDEHQIEVEIAPTGSLPPVLADPRRARQVLRNLVENAVKYSPGGGRIVIAVQPGEGDALVSVTDQGIGIAAPQLDRVFERFYQVDSASTRKVGGTGLGLSISKAIVEAHGGRIWAESQPGRGSTFYFTLPTVPDELPARPAGSGRPRLKEETGNNVE